MSSDLYADAMCQFLPHLVGQPYWYGTHLQNCTQELLDRRRAQYPNWYTAEREASFQSNISNKMICSDCVGMIKGYAWTDGGQGVLEAIGTGTEIHQVYESNGCPDLSANGMFEWAIGQGAQHGPIATIPTKVGGIAVHKDGHCGVYIGDGHVIEFRGYGLGCAQTNLAQRNFTDWYYLPFIIYTPKPKYFFMGGAKRRGRVTIYV